MMLLENGICITIYIIILSFYKGLAFMTQDYVDFSFDAWSIVFKCNIKKYTKFDHKTRLKKIPNFLTCTT